MKKQLKIFFAGVFMVVPFAVTIYVIVSVGNWIDAKGQLAISSLGWKTQLPPALGAVALILGIYFVGLLAQFWVFRWLIGLTERAVEHMPGIKTIYQSVRDLLKLFGGNSSQMGKVVQYKVPGTEISLLGIMTNSEPAGIHAPDADRRVAIYLPFSYQFGGPTIYVSPEHITEVPMSVEEALRVCAMAQVGCSTKPPEREHFRHHKQPHARVPAGEA